MYSKSKIKTLILAYNNNTIKTYNRATKPAFAFPAAGALAGALAGKKITAIPHCKC